uniref:Uncharacterized protein n=1 Tax=Glossina palpalis gambiensis TaxID=67801 RepID=A0A1B0BWD7_9MUSC
MTTTLSKSSLSNISLAGVYIGTDIAMTNPGFRTLPRKSNFKIDKVFKSIHSGLNKYVQEMDEMVSPSDIYAIFSNARRILVRLKQQQQHLNRDKALNWWGNEAARPQSQINDYELNCKARVINV